MGSTLTVLLPLLALYCLFLFWYGGNGKPMGRAEIDGFKEQLGGANAAMMNELELLVASDDGREFVMQNLVRYRARALYPPGLPYDDNPRKADQRYGRAIMGPLLRRASVPLFIAGRAGNFIAPAGATHWDYVAMVRYRSRRDFLRFAVEIEQGGITMHKWAAIEETMIFPVKPVVSLFFVRAMVAGFLALTGLMLLTLLR